MVLARKKKCCSNLVFLRIPEIVWKMGRMWQDEIWQWLSPSNLGLWCKKCSTICLSCVQIYLLQKQDGNFGVSEKKCLKRNNLFAKQSLTSMDCTEENASIILVRETLVEMHSDINQCRMSPLQILRRMLSWLL